MARKKRKSSQSPRRPAAAPAERAQHADRAGGHPRATTRRWFVAVVIAVAATASILATAYFHTDLASMLGKREIASTPSSPPPAAARYVGGDACVECHAAQRSAWHGSDHDLAMEVADEKSVLGNFTNAKFAYAGTTSTFFRRDGKFFVNTDGPDGKLADYEIKYTFGVHPLQQYLVDFPGGRKQALGIAWDSRPATAGGQRWFHLYPGQNIKAGDYLHWTAPGQNWNFMCAECHSTGVRKNYDEATDRFATTWAEISVGCEGCHGQGSGHVEWARHQQSWWPFGTNDTAKGLLVRFNERSDVHWTHDPRTSNPQRSLAPAILRKEIETCGLCHGRRGEFSENWIPGQWLSDTHAVALISRGLYSADGQMLDEVYNYGSFKQSKMFAAGVTCSDCHDPHTAKLRAPGDGVCRQCHALDKYATVAHRRHDGASPSLACASCHMPVRTYMVVDQRHDHSFRIPRPDLSIKLGTPNACNDCHADKAAAWAAAAIEQWHGPTRKGSQNYAEAFQAAWTDKADAEKLLAAVAADASAPAIARASALAELASRISPSNMGLARTGISDPDPMVRLGALDMLEGMPAAQLWPLVSRLLSDSNRGVRIRAAALLAAVPTAGQPSADRERFERAAGEFIAAQRLNADRPEARSTLGNFYARRGRGADAEGEYKAALRLSPHYTPAAVNLADLYRQLGRDGDAENVLRQAIATSPLDAGLHHALGLTLTRLKRPDEALAELRRAAELEPDRGRYAYVYAVALQSGGRRDEATAVLRDGLARHPDDRDILQALMSYSRDAGDIATALAYAERLARIVPDDRDLAALIQVLRRQAAKPNGQ
jgi:predicted CXXCH cytochrome family protein